MNRMQFFKTCGAALAVTASTPVTSLAKERDQDKLELSDCPKRVRKTIKSFAGEGDVVKVEKERIYKARVVRRGQKLEFLVAENGNLIAIEAVGKRQKEREESEEEGNHPKKERGRDEEDQDKDRGKGERREGNKKEKDEEREESAKPERQEKEDKDDEEGNEGGKRDNEEEEDHNK
jgi:hypothetical protein